MSRINMIINRYNELISIPNEGNSPRLCEVIYELLRLRYKGSLEFNQDLVSGKLYGFCVIKDETHKKEVLDRYYRLIDYYRESKHPVYILRADEARRIYFIYSKRSKGIKYD